MKGYSDLFTLSKDDLWEALEEYPDAKINLLEKGKQILIKDNMIDTDKANEDNNRKEELGQKVGKLEEDYNNVRQDAAQIITEFTSLKIKINQRLERMENKIK